MPLSEAQITTEACYFKTKKSGGHKKRWHRVLKYYPNPIRAHIAYCGKIQLVDQKQMLYAGEYNNRDETILKDWVDCLACETYYRAVVRAPAQLQTPDHEHNG